MCRYFKRVAGFGSVIMFIFGNLKDSLMKILQLLQQSTIILVTSYLGTETRVEFKGSCWKQDKVRYDHGKVVNINIVYEISKNYDISNYPTLENCLFSAVVLIKNADIDRFKYSGYGIRFDRKVFLSHFSGGPGKNVITSRYKFIYKD